VCILGWRLAAAGYSDLSGALLEAEKRAADAERSRLEAVLEEAESRALRAIAEAADDPAVLERLVRESRFISEPYIFTADGLAVPPLSRVPGSVPPVLEEPPRHQEVDRALVVAWSRGPSAEAIAGIDVASRSAPPAVRLRAAAAAAALLARSGDLPGAVERHERIARELGEQISGSSYPTRLQLALARAECLLRAGKRDEIPGVVREALEAASRDLPAGGLDEERFFAARARAILEESGAAPPEVLLRMERACRERLVLRSFVDVLADWIFARRGLDRDPAQIGKPRHFVEDLPRVSGAAVQAEIRESRRPLVAVWASVAPPPSGPGLSAVGYIAEPAGLVAFLDEALRSGAAPTALTVRVDPPDADFLELGSLPGERSHVRLGIPRAAWEDLLRRARRPFVLAKALVGLLGMASVLAFVAFSRGLRREMALSRMKTELVANVSHELKTPIALIRLFGETLLLDRVSDPERRKEALGIIIRESERLTHLISNVLDFASIEAGKKAYRLEPQDLSSVARETYERYRFQLEAKGFTHRFETDQDLPPVLADPDAVAQALLNLIENAIKYSPERKEIAILVDRAPGGVRIRVEDRGMGIPPEDRRRIWDDFYRSKAARALGTRGSGLGLSLVRHIVEAHGGAVSVESAPGEGSRFELIFPALERANERES
jgi:signal transduction histidine kinase